MSDTLKRLFKRVQQEVGDLEDALLGDRVERLLDQDIRDTDQALHRARDDANGIKAQRIAAETAADIEQARVAALRAEITDLLGRGRLSKAKSRERATVLLDAAAKASEIATQADELLAAERQLLHLIEQLEARLRRIKHQLGTARAATSIQRAQAAVAQRQPTPDVHPEVAQAAAQRVRERSQESPAKPPSSKIRKSASARELEIDALLEELAPATLSASTTRSRTTTKKAPARKAK